MNAYFVGMSLSSLVPSLLKIIQGDFIHFCILLQIDCRSWQLQLRAHARWEPNGGEGNPNRTSVWRHVLQFAHRRLDVCSRRCILWVA